MTTRLSLFFRAHGLTAGLLAATGYLILPACNADDGAADGLDGTAGTETAGDGDPTTGDGDPTTGDGDPTTGDGDGDLPGCGELGCACSQDSCDPGLACIAGFCAETVCGDGEIEGDEECEDQNGIDGDGCDNDCTLTRVAEIHAGQHHTCAVIDGGSLRCWGRGEFGQLGYGNVNTVGDDEYPSDVGDVPLPGAVVHLVLGGQHSCGIFADGGLRCWGLNERGQLGNGTLNNLGDDESLANLLPVSVPPAIEVALGDRHTCARVGAGEVRCWGANDFGQLGYANTFVPTPEMLLPGGVVELGGLSSRLEAGSFHTCSRFIGGALRCWGRNDSGQLGYGNVVAIGDDELPAVAGPVSLIPPTLPANTELVSLALGGGHTCALLGGGEVLCWGANSAGQLGQGNLNPVGDDELPSTQAPVALGGPAKAVTAGANHSCALMVDGTVRCWGDNSAGQLGYGNPDFIGDDELPELAGSGVQLVTGGNHNCVLRADGEVLCWGQNNFAQLGIGSTVTVGDNETPAEVDPVRILD